MTETAAGAEAPAKNKSIIDPKYRNKYKTPDWLAQILIDNASTTKEVKTKVVVDGKVTDQETTKTVNTGVDIDKLFAIARENGLNVDKYDAQRGGHGFSGRFRMTVRNMLQATVKQRHGLTLNGAWVEADPAFLAAKEAPEVPTHNHDGSKIAVAKVNAAPVAVDPKPAPAQTAKAKKKK